jgi:hypothetical protein
MITVLSDGQGDLFRHQLDLEFQLQRGLPEAEQHQ